MGVAGVVHHEVENHPDAASMRLVDEAVEVGLRTEQRIHPFVVADVVAEVQAGRRVDRRQPDGVDPEAVRAEMIEVPDDPAQIADTIAIRVGEAARVDLVDDPALPPVVAEARLFERRGRSSRCPLRRGTRVAVHVFHRRRHHLLTVPDPMWINARY
jgi:hypothetical protein